MYSLRTSPGRALRFIQTPPPTTANSQLSEVLVLIN